VSEISKMQSLRISRLQRLFQPQIPQVFRPALTSVLAKTIGRVSLERPAVGLMVTASWIRFSRWCNAHPIREAITKTNGHDRGWLYRSVIEGEGLDRQPITYLEFGVYRGESLKSWLHSVSNPASRFIGFDTFTGLPERWRPTEPAGHFDAKGRVPDVNDDRCTFEVGLFQETLPQFVAGADLSRKLIVNLDADMFTSTLFVLTTLAPYFKPGDLIFFDEFSCPLDEFRAFEEFVSSFRITYEVIAAVYGYTRVCVKILAPSNLKNSQQIQTVSLAGRRSA
jgi:O-methyltransferase